MMSLWLIKLLHCVGLTNLTDAMVNRYVALVSHGQATSPIRVQPNFSGDPQGERPPSWLAGVAVAAAVMFLVILAFLAQKSGANIPPDLAKLDKRLDALAASLENVEGDVKGAKGRLEAAESSLSQVRSGLMSLQNDLVETKKAMPDKTAVVAAAREEAKEAAKKVAEASLTPLSDKLDRAFQAIKDEASARKGEAANFKAATDDLKKQYAALREMATATKGEVDDLKAAVGKLGHGDMVLGQKLSGTWNITDVMTDAEPHIDARRLGVSLTFDVDKLTISVRDKEIQKNAEASLGFATDADQVPARINLHWRDEKMGEEVVKLRPYLGVLMRPDVSGIYERKGDSLQLCLGDVGGVARIHASRPQEFKPGGEAKAVLIKLERAKKD